MVPYFIDFSKYAIENLIAGGCFLAGMERKKSFCLRSFAVVSTSVLLSAVLAMIATHADMGDYGIVAGSVYTLLNLMLFLFAGLCFRGTVWNRLFCCISGVILRMCAKKLFDIVLVLWELAGNDILLLQKGTLLRYLIYYPILIAAYAVGYIFFGRLFRDGGILSMNMKVSTVYLMFLSINAILNNIEPLLRAVDIRAYGLLIFCEVAYYSLFLCMQSFLFELAQAEAESRITQELWRQDKRQYEQIRESIEIVNIKCHDLRHQLRVARESGRVDEGFLREVEQSISIYDSSVKSGNETLDVILTDKRLHCEAAGIQLTCMADGRQLCFMEPRDIISMFSNLLENAMEYESVVPEMDKRFISLTVRPVERFLDIHMENYFEGRLEMRGGLPMTHKQDEGNHGYGLRSVQRIVERYGGSMKIKVEDGMFQINILFPLQSE